MITKFKKFINETSSYLEDNSPAELFDENETYETIMYALEINREDAIDYFIKWYEDKFESQLFDDEKYKIIIEAFKKKQLKLVDTMNDDIGAYFSVKQLFRIDTGFDVALYLYNKYIKSDVALQDYVSISLGAVDGDTEYVFGGSIKNMQKLLKMNIQLDGGCLKEIYEDCTRGQIDAFNKEILKIYKNNPSDIPNLFGLCSNATLIKYLPKDIWNEISYLFEIKQYNVNDN